MGAAGQTGTTSTFAVVVNWNGGEDNLTCIDSLLSEGVPSERIVFVDNASDDGSLESVRKRYPALLFLCNDSNTGYGHAVNRGTERALELGAQRVLWVNNDLTFAPGALALMGRALEADSTLGLVGPRIVYRDQPAMIWSAGGHMTWRQNLSTLIGHRQADGPRFQRTERVDYVAGAALLARREVFEEVGLLDGEFFAYHEDLEFCLRAGAAGFGVACVGEALALHAAHAATGGGYNPRRKYMMAVNTVRFLRQHGTPMRWCSFALFDVATLPVAWLLRLPRGEGGAVLAKARGTWHGLIGRRVDAAAVRELYARRPAEEE